MDDWTLHPLPSTEQVDRAAADLLHIAELEPLQCGGVTFRRRDLALTGWHNPDLGYDWNGDLEEIAIPLREVYVCDDTVNQDLTRRQNLARCRLAVWQAIDRRDQDIVLMGEAIQEQGR